jgi:ABC transport system ATP-binding/permease protein
MDVVLLEYLLRLFAVIANLFPSLFYKNVKDFIKSFLLKELNPEIENECLRLFDEYYQKYNDAANPGDIENFQHLLNTVRQIEHDVPRKQQFQILLRLLFFEKFLLKYPVIDYSYHIRFEDILTLVIENFHISEPEYLNCRGFIRDTLYKIPHKNRLMVISNKKNFDLNINYLCRKNLSGQLFFLYIESINTLLFNYKGNGALTLGNQNIFSNHIYFFPKGTSIKGYGIESIYYNQILRRFQWSNVSNLHVDINDIEFTFKNSNNGIHQLKINFESEQLIGIIGRSGVGKSTLLNIFIGNIKPHRGCITVNGHDLHEDTDKLDGFIGYVPQDDLLIEELSVFTNLYLNAQLCFANLSPQTLTKKVNNLLVDLDLYDARNLKVGSPLNKYISGGQRKKLNIALELIRGPWILFADEPTSGLSSSDSEEIMQLLSEQTITGRIVVLNIHQPSSDVFKLFDKIIVLDKEGYPVYIGNPLDAIPYFNDYTQRISTAADNCNVCENINPETIFKILEEKKVNEFGEFTKERKITPLEWHRLLLNKLNKESQENEPVEPLPKIQFNKPKPFKQFLIFGKRNLLSKLANKQYVLLALSISPILAIVLASLCRYSSILDNNEYKYIFAQNDNIPSFLFMSVIVAVFIGLIISAEEIIRDRKILLRESYLKLSKLSYLNSKVIFLFVLSCIQTLSYVIIGNVILGIHGMSFSYWLILFSLSCFANLLGLLISSFFTTVVAIYIMVPLIIVPQILLSGVVVNYNKLNNYVASKEYVPLVGDLVPSRWAYEALMVTQFARNDFQKYYFKTEQQESNTKYYLLFIIPEIKKVLYDIRLQNPALPAYKHNLEFLQNEIQILQESEYVSRLMKLKPDTPKFLLLEKRLDQLNTVFSNMLDQLSHKKDSITHSLVLKLGGVDNYLEYKSRYYNENIADWVLKRKALEAFIKADNKTIRTIEPIYQLSGSNYGRTHFLSSSKKICNLQFDTLTFNVLVIWLMSAILYATLIIFSIFIKKT